jgi:HEAT repeat protein
MQFGGCVSDSSSLVGFEEPDPQARLRAAEQAGARQDLSAIPSLIRMLDSDDAAERFYAIGSLKSLSGGETFGYQHFAERAQRHEAIGRWVEWWSNNERNPNALRQTPVPATTRGSTNG